MTKQTGTKKTSRKQHSPEFKEEALALAEKIGIPKAAKELGLHDSQLYGWRSKARTAIFLAVAVTAFALPILAASRR